MSQPAVSLQIRHLERELGVVLLDRNTSRATVTPAGTALLAFAEHVEQGNAQLHRQLAMLQNEHAFVSIGCSATSAKQFVPRIISAVSQIAPEVHVRVITQPPDEAVAKAVRGELDFVLTTEGFLSSRLEAEQILTARLFIVGHPSHPLCRRQKVTPEELARYPFCVVREVEHEDVALLWVRAVEARECLHGLDAGEHLVNVHRVQQGFVVAGLELVGADEEAVRVLLDLVGDSVRREAVERGFRDLLTAKFWLPEKATMALYGLFRSVR